MSAPTSSAGRRQFSLEKANRVSADASPRRSRWRGSGLDSGAVAGDARQAAALGPAAVAVHDHGDMTRKLLLRPLSFLHVRHASDLHQFFFLIRENMIDLGDVLVGELLHVVLCPVIVVLGDFEP